MQILDQSEMAGPVRVISSYPKGSGPMGNKAEWDDDSSFCRSTIVLRSQPDDSKARARRVMQCPLINDPRIQGGGQYLDTRPGSLSNFHPVNTQIKATSFSSY